MHFYVLQVQTGGESRFLDVIGSRHPALREDLLWPRRSLRIRRRGVWAPSLAPIFPGYVFLRAPAVDSDRYWTLRRTPGFIRFLPDNHNVIPLARKDQELVSHFLSFGEVVDRSLAFFDEDRRIRVVAGPLKGMEGKIVKVDRRKGRARVRLELYSESFLIDFGFASLEGAPGEAQSVSAVSRDTDG